MYTEISTDELLSRLEQGEKLYLIDVREPDEWADGHVAEAISIPLSQLQARVGELASNGEEPFILMCRSGNRSSRACDYLAALGYEVVNVAGGMLNWNGKVVTGE
ncbi:rhodanese-related sulfurtransferase [Paenibacillus cellulosilyticus]|uniref:Rhodanese-related sulfurtransferase n=1 Tax=Paenibacillus cellulosilyticus TaxID=375489 RepID=A0A2V2YXX5_9BACL|nr:rhodanese-like domain-containing protein [Paenibacillus cellulosilyticus]PWW06493.1 rhodanese-related sulfurtransferase [Paenibacillus cellulosilyticus]QKS46167.1 rhodanese-like domain-containing protein [Paenibacillus cellulosilyticus]